MIPSPLPAKCFAEMLGTFLLVFFGCGSVHVAVLTGELTGLWQIGVVWAIAIMLAIYVCGPISGAHINPAITAGLAVWGLFPKAHVVAYTCSQLAGATVAAGLLYALFHPFLSLREQEKGVVRGAPGSEITAMCYGEYYPNPGLLGSGRYDEASHNRLNQLVAQPVACLAELLGTAVLALVVVAVTEPGYRGGPRNLAPVFIGLTVAALITVLAPITQACFNPARDFGPRLFAYFAGWGAVALPGPRGAGFATVYILSPTLGGIAGVGLYQLLLKPHILSVSVPEGDP